MHITNFVGDNDDNDANGANEGFARPTTHHQQTVEVDVYDETYCPSCGNEEALIVEEGGYECRYCGVKHDIKLNMEQEWRYYGDSDSKGNDPNRVGMPTNSLLPESSLGSMIGSKGGDFSKLRQYHQYNIMPYKERSLWNTFTYIQGRCQQANIPPSLWRMRR